MPRDEGKGSTNRRGQSRINSFKPWRAVFLLLLLAFLLRLLLVLRPEVIHNDGVEYIRHAKEFLAGNWMGGASGPVYPALISFGYLFTRNYELSGILISAIFGSLLVLPIFYLGKAIFDEKVGILSALLSVVHPFLYRFSGSALTESTYYFLLTTSVVFGWEAFRKGKLQSAFFFGLFSTLTYLTKPEGVGLILVFSAWILLVNPSQRRRPWTNRVGIFLLTVFCFLLFSSPYLILLKKELGKWGISKKASVTIEAFSREETGAAVQRGAEGVKINIESFFTKPFPFVKAVSLGFLFSLYRFQQAFHPILLILAIFGWIGIFRNRARSDVKGSFYVFSHHLFFLGCVLPFFGIYRRYASQMVAISLPWAAFGCLEIMGWVKKWLKREDLEKRVSFLLLFVLLCGLFLQGSLKHFHDSRLIQKEAGLWMKENLPGGAKIMSRLPQEAFYGELEWTGIPGKNYEEVLKTARSTGVQYLAIDENIEELSPGFFAKIGDKDLVLLTELKDGNQKIAIFEIVYPE